MLTDLNLSGGFKSTFTMSCLSGRCVLQAGHMILSCLLKNAWSASSSQNACEQLVIHAETVKRFLHFWLLQKRSIFAIPASKPNINYYFLILLAFFFFTWVSAHDNQHSFLHLTLHLNIPLVTTSCESKTHHDHLCSYTFLRHVASTGNLIFAKRRWH